MFVVLLISLKEDEGPIFESYVDPYLTSWLHDKDIIQCPETKTGLDITFIVRESWLCHYGHVVRFSESVPACRILIAGDWSGWPRPRRCPCNTWLR